MFDLSDRFWRRVQIGSSDDCWPWLGARNASGYGKLRRCSKYDTAHRVAHALTKGPIPEGGFVLHSCDNPPCCNPTHLHTGDHDLNMQEAVDRDRTAYHERHGQAKLTEEQALEIPARWASGSDSLNQLACAYGVSRRAITALVTRETWQRLGVEPVRLDPDRLKRGERNGRAKLTVSQVQNIRRAFDEGVSRAHLARTYAVSWTLIDDIVKGILWSDLRVVG